MFKDLGKAETFVYEYINKIEDKIPYNSCTKKAWVWATTRVKKTFM